jgi:simple sugar transport system ATP-binding protein
MLVEPLSALDNIMLGAEGHWRLTQARTRVRGELQALMDETGLQVRLDAAVEDLPVGERQRLEILKALDRGARILVADLVLPDEAMKAVNAVSREIMYPMG